MKYCKLCGAQNDDDAVFCTQCGAEIQSVPPAVLKKKRWLLPVLLVLILVAAAATYINLKQYFTDQRISEETAERIEETSSSLSQSQNEAEKKVQKANAKAGEEGGPVQSAISRTSEQGTATAREAGEKIDQIAETGSKIAGQEIDRTVETGKILIENMEGDKYRPMFEGDPSPLPVTATDMERSSDYQYEPSPCDELLTNLVKRSGYSIGKKLLEVTNIPDQEEMKVSSLLREEYINIFPNQVDVNSTLVSYVRSVGEYLTRGVRRKGIKYHFHVVEADSVNAFAIPGGGIYVFRGLLDELENEAMLAFVLAHEIAHVDLRHCIALHQVMMQLPEAAARSEYTFSALEYIEHPFQTEIEMSADSYALELCYRLNYSPFQAVKIWNTILGDGYHSGGGNLLTNIFEAAKKEVENITKTHPESELRACKLKNKTIGLQEQWPKEKFYIGNYNYRDKISYTQKVY